MHKNRKTPTLKDFVKDRKYILYYRTYSKLQQSKECETYKGIHP